MRLHILVGIMSVSLVMSTVSMAGQAQTQVRNAPSSQISASGSSTVDRPVVVQQTSGGSGVLSNLFESIANAASSVVSAIKGAISKAVTTVATSFGFVTEPAPAVPDIPKSVPQAPVPVGSDTGKTSFGFVTAPVPTVPGVPKTAPSSPVNTGSDTGKTSFGFETAPAVPSTPTPVASAPQAAPQQMAPEPEMYGIQEAKPLNAMVPATVVAPPATVASKDILNYDKVQVAPTPAPDTELAKPAALEAAKEASAPVEAPQVEAAATATVAPSTQIAAKSVTQSSSIQSSSVGSVADRQIATEPSSGGSQIVAENQVASNSGLSISTPSTIAAQGTRLSVGTTSTSASTTQTTAIRQDTPTTRVTTTNTTTTPTEADRLAAAERERLALAERARLAAEAAARQTAATQTDAERLAAEVAARQTEADRLAAAERERLATETAARQDTTTATQTDAERLAAEVAARTAAAAATERYVDGAVNPDSWIRDALEQTEAERLAAEVAARTAAEATTAANSAAASGDDQLAGVEYSAKLNRDIGTVASGNDIVAAGMENQLGVAAAGTDKPVGENNATSGEEKPVGIDANGCQSTIFDCSKLKIYSSNNKPQNPGKEKEDEVYIGVIKIAKNNHLIWMMGKDFFAPIDPMTKVGLLCKGEGLMFPVGKDKNGYTMATVFEKDKKIQALTGDGLKLFKKIIIDNGKPVEELVKGDPVECDFDKYFAGTGVEGMMYTIPEVEDAKYGDEFGIVDNKIVMLFRDGKQNGDGSNETHLKGIEVIDVAESTDKSHAKIWTFPDNFKMKQLVHDFIVTTAEDGHVVVDMNVPFDNKADGGMVVSCHLYADKTQAECEKKDVNNTKELVKDTIAKKIILKSKHDIKNESFGVKVATKLMTDDVKADATVYKFEGFGKVPDAVVVYGDKNVLLREQVDGSVAVDPQETYPGARQCVVVDVDNYGGPDQFCLMSGGIYFLPKQNLNPVIDVIDVVNADSNVQSELKPTVQTQEGEDLTYKWTLEQIVDGKPVDHTDYLSDVTSETPFVNWPTEAAAVPAGAVNVEINANAPIAKSMGAKSAGDNAATDQNYTARLVVTDPAGATATAEVNLSKSVGGGVKVVGFGTDSGGSGSALTGAVGKSGELPGIGGVTLSDPTVSPTGATYGSSMRGGCTLIRQ
ncbi:MAG: hypothetical protein COV45_06190 [Deltaproteobacteria bacterium CG11_big_fil_rev_8_21_14_0_20_47_16]|nr:MAG: hypothetical protein COV45_06190 [Deltaproteobacteria bacterium CG11_big_fil_rev_8_21_14_0_20_47_16]